MSVLWSNTKTFLSLGSVVLTSLEFSTLQGEVDARRIMCSARQCFEDPFWDDVPFWLPCENAYVKSRESRRHKVLPS